MDAATIFTAGIGVFAAMELSGRIVSSLSRRIAPWLAKRMENETGARDDHYVFFRMRDLTGEAPGKPFRTGSRTGATRPRPRLGLSA